MLTRAIKPGYKILDLGANIGYYVLMELQLMKGQGHVIAIEPEPNNYRQLINNISLNSYQSQTTTINAAVSNQDGVAQLFLSRLGNVHSLKQNQTSQYSGHAIPVKTISLTSLAKQHPDLDLIRMDIEGYEQEVLDSLVSINQHTKFLPRLLLELHPPKYNHPRWRSLLSSLFHIGYRARFLASSHKNLLIQHKLKIVASIPTDGTIRHIAARPSLKSVIALYPRSRAILLDASTE